VLLFLWHWTGDYSAHYLATHVTEAAGWYWDIVRKSAAALALVARVVITLVTFVVVGTFAALPFNDLLSEQTDKLAGGWRDPRPFSPFRMGWELAVTGAQEGKRMSMYLVLIVPLFLLSFIPILAPFTLTLKVVITALFFTTDYLSYPMERRGALLFKHKFSITRRYFFPSLGFGCAVTCLALVPVVNFMFFPLAVVGGTLLFSDLVRQHGEEMRRGLPARFNPYGPPGVISPPPGFNDSSETVITKTARPSSTAPPPPPPPPGSSPA
jgi:uncharacterized protein involved in cysteine biosynthesis